jgi:hypothetical protein
LFITETDKVHVKSDCCNKKNRSRTLTATIKAVLKTFPTKITIK